MLIQRVRKNSIPRISDKNSNLPFNKRFSSLYLSSSSMPRNSGMPLSQFGDAVNAGLRRNHSVRHTLGFANCMSVAYTNSNICQSHIPYIGLRHRVVTDKDVLEVIKLYSYSIYVLKAE